VLAAILNHEGGGLSSLFIADYFDKLFLKYEQSSRVELCRMIYLSFTLHFISKPDLQDVSAKPEKPSPAWRVGT